MAYRRKNDRNLLTPFAIFDRFVSFFPAYFTQNPSPRTWIIRISSADKALALSGLIKNVKILRIIVQTTTSPFWFPAQNMGGKLFAHAVHIY